MVVVVIKHVLVGVVHIRFVYLNIGQCIVLGVVCMAPVYFSAKYCQGL